jgi:hypothetical protein
MSRVQILMYETLIHDWINTFDIIHVKDNHSFQRIMDKVFEDFFDLKTIEYLHLSIDLIQMDNH